MGNSKSTESSKDVTEESNTQEESKDSATGSKDNLVEYSNYEKDISTGDLAILKHEDVHHFAIFIRPDEGDSCFPLLLAKGKTKPMPTFDPKTPRHAHTVSAAQRIFYGDYEAVSVRSLEPKGNFNCRDIMEIVDKIPTIKFSDAEIEVISKVESPQERSSVVCTLMVAHFYKEMGLLKADPATITPDNLEDHLSLAQPVYIKLPPVKEGPLTHGDPPFLSKLVDGIFPPPHVKVVPLNSITNDLNTGDIILFSGATSSGAVIKFFDHSLFSHVGIIIRTKYTSQPLVWEASTNKAGLVDVQSGTVNKGVELLPLKHKIFSGWYDRVAVRRLTGIDDEKRKEMYEELFKFLKEVQGRPYEKDKVELLLSAFDFQEEYLTFLQNSKEDLSSLFCSELVAEAYKRMGLFKTEKLSNEFTPDDFASKNDEHNQLQLGKLEEEVYLELKFD